MKRKIIKVLSLNELHALHTGTLMARRKQLLMCEDSLAHSDQNDNFSIPDNQILFKDDPNWAQAYQDLKQVLATRENWPPKKS